MERKTGGWARQERGEAGRQGGERELQGRGSAGLLPVISSWGKKDVEGESHLCRHIQAPMMLKFPLGLGRDPSVQRDLMLRVTESPDGHTCPGRFVHRRF